MKSGDNNSSAADAIGKLIASAGPGSTARPEAKQRIYDAVHERWQATISRSTEQGDSEQQAAAGSDPIHHQRNERTGTRRIFRTAQRYRAIGIAATVAICAIGAYRLQQTPPAPVSVNQELAQFARVEGSVEILHNDGSLQQINAESGVPVRLGDTLRTGEDGRVGLRLQDDILMRLNVASEMIFSATDSVDLKAGTVYVDTGGDGSDFPLRIETPLGDIAHLGTQYEVRASESALRVRVREGSVVYSGSNGTAVGQAGEQLDIDQTGLAARSAVAPNDSEWQWVTALATLPQADEYQASEVLAWVARERGLELDYASAAEEQRLSDQMIVGLEGLNPVETLDVIQRTMNIAAEVSGQRLLISSP
jgi:ferric-dicitrate binding protein FerR (iron transport regulator)